MIADCYGSNVGLNDVSNQSIHLYPNPSHGELFIVNDAVLGATEIVISDISGKIVYQKKELLGKEYALSTDLIPGVYIITLASDSGNYTERFVVE